MGAWCLSMTSLGSDVSLGMRMLLLAGSGCEEGFFNGNNMHSPGLGPLRSNPAAATKAAAGTPHHRGHNGVSFRSCKVCPAVGSNSCSILSCPVDTPLQTDNCCREGKNQVILKLSASAVVLQKCLDGSGMSWSLLNHTLAACSGSAALPISLERWATLTGLWINVWGWL